MISDPSVFEKPVVITNQRRFLVAEQLAELGVAATIVLEPERRDSRPHQSPLRPRTGRQRLGRLPSSRCSRRITSTKSRRVHRQPQDRHSDRGQGQHRQLRHQADPSGHQFRLYPSRRSRRGDSGAQDPGFRREAGRGDCRALYLEGYLWNSGNFVFPAETMRGEIERFEPEMASAVAEAVAKPRPIWIFSCSTRRTRPQEIHRLRRHGADRPRRRCRGRRGLSRRIGVRRWLRGDRRGGEIPFAATAWCWSPANVHIRPRC